MSASSDLSAPEVPFTIRSATPSDTPALLALAIAAGLFPPHEVDFLRDTLDNCPADHQVEVWSDDPSGEPVVNGVVYFGPNPMTNCRVWDLWMIAVAPERQRQGIGGELLKFTETRVRAGGGQFLIIETSSQPKYDATRAFYRQHGYAEVGCIPDFYGDGDSKIIYHKKIAQAQEIGRV
jgi:ribosomal protein S18 acetylase RimI-like enzyme